MIKAVIFDMDGVLIDSEIVYLRYQYQALKKQYPWVSPESLYPTVGMSMAEHKCFLARLLRRDIDDPAFRQELSALEQGCAVSYADILNPQAVPVLRALRERGLSVALASSSDLQTIHKVLAECGIGAYFGCVVSGDQFRRSKPDPEIYRYTMRRLQCRPAECLVVEDSTYGVQAGVAAGAAVAALRDDRFPFDQSAARFRIESLAEILSLIDAENGAAAK